ncbi:MAG: hypothetical protein R3A52_30125 [Polyangiales bacterium]
MLAPSSSRVAAAANIPRTLLADPDRLAVVALAAVVALRVHPVAGLAAGLALTLGFWLSRRGDRRSVAVTSAPVARVIDLSAARARRSAVAARAARQPPARAPARRLRLIASAESPS